MDPSLNSNQTATVDYSHFLQVNETNQNFVAAILETTIFQILKNHSDVFIFNEFEIYDIKSGNRAIVIENGVLIGSGGHGNVYYTYNPQTNKKAALKVQNNCPFQAVNQYAEEFKIQKIIEAIFPECIIKIQGKVFISQNYVDNYKMHTYLELGLGSLKDYQKKINIFSPTEIDNIYNCIMDSIIKIHTLKIAHRDIKLDNIIKSKENGWVLADFGCSTQYKTPYGEYPIVGTILYCEKSIRQAYAQGRRKCKMNLFKNDIYAFQLVMLQLIYPEKSMLDLNTILDQKQMIHPKINQLYNKDYCSIKRELSQLKFIRKTLITDDDFNVINLDSTQDDFKNDSLMQSIFNYLSFQKQIKVFFNILRKMIYEEYQKNMLNGNEVQKFTLLFFYYFQFKTVQEIYDQINFEELSKLEYEVYFDVFQKRGSKILQLMLCQRYQEILGDNNKNIKLQEAELLYIMGLMDEAKLIINSIQHPQELEGDEQMLKYCCLKARLNNQWAENHEDIIHYLRNYKDTYQVLFEWKFLLIDSVWIDISKRKENKIYKKFFQTNYDILQQNTKGQPTNTKFEIITLDKYLEKPSFDQDDPKFVNFLSQLKKPLSQVVLMKEFLNFDNYSIFYYCWIYLEGTDFFGEKYRYQIEEFIKFIEENLQGYYFNWIIFDLYSQYLTYYNELQMAEVYIQKALQIVKNDCIYHQLIVHHHLLRLRLKQQSRICQTTLRIISNLLHQLPSSNLRFYYTQFIQEEEEAQSKQKSKKYLWNYVFLGSDTRKYIEIDIKYQYNKNQFMEELNFNKLRQNMEEHLPNLIEKSNDDVLKDFHNLIWLGQENEIEATLILNLILRYIQFRIVFQQLGQICKFQPFNYLEDELFYNLHVLQGHKKKQEEEIISQFYYYCQSWL